MSIFIAFILLCVSCSPSEENLHYEGVTGSIINIDDNSFLIQSNNEKVDLTITNDTVFEGKDRNDFKKGDKVKTWYSNEPLDSNPLQVGASKIEFIE
ncbi:DUF3221 domain-containing protein [Aquisalibacillus elongatus]|uniref:Uncharacterized protein DUF3221 n=1 Tax=Aquisalibacillus elongatus TaxID=485577 RepID=A0A3N5C7S9_9BACI|nr:DUF3221 domain-containing protein [Aquisalibacillus elongatus]RPF54435.1 uncharacterized protein DUF3221 [Aquisalibacillus elongatus]